MASSRRSPPPRARPGRRPPHVPPNAPGTHALTWPQAKGREQQAQEQQRRRLQLAAAVAGGRGGLHPASPHSTRRTATSSAVLATGNAGRASGGQRWSSRRGGYFVPSGQLRGGSVTFQASSAGGERSSRRGRAAMEAPAPAGPRDGRGSGRLSCTDAGDCFPLAA